MKQGYLSQYFRGVAVKRLSAVEARSERSNQHEFNGVNKLTSLLGPAIPKRKFAATFLYLCDDDSEPIVSMEDLTWYDARESHPQRSENRLYFPSTAVSDCATEGDLLLIAKKPDESLLVVIAEAGSTIENQLLWLLGESDIQHPGFSVKGEIENDQVKLDFLSRLMLEQVGIEATETEENLLDQMLHRFDGRFPDTAVLSAYVRDMLDIDPRENPDAVLVAWYEKEFILFRTLEEHFLAPAVTAGFETVREFLDLSLTVQNRRKSRAGNALQNHLSAIFEIHGLSFQKQAVTENRSRPDFTFPGSREYHDPFFPTDRLSILAAKTSLKERWRQVLTEANRVPTKHLCTLEPGISEFQTDQMVLNRVRLVVPGQYHPTFNLRQREWLLTLSQFISHVRDQQGHASS